MAIYAAAICASKPDPLGDRCPDINFAVTVFDAYNAEHAEGRALAKARDRWPQDNGWRDHKASIVEIPPSELKKILEGDGKS